MPTCTTCSQEIAVASAFCSHCGSPNPEAPGVRSGESDALLLQRRLQAALGDAYTVEGPLGEGGFAVVFGVFDRKLSRRIAVKVLRPELTASRASKQRFVREAETVARLNHPHILPIFFVGENQGLVYFGMPLVEGETLEARLRKGGRLSEAEAARIGAEIADALAEAHAAGLVHRDIKPLNVMLQGNRGRVLVADFGIAKAAAGSGEDKLTGTGIAIGSPHYMSPEQAAGDEHVDQRSDIYSLGILLWQMLAGEPPFVTGGSQAVIMQQVSREVPPISTVRADTSADMAAIVTRATQKKRDDRFQSADEIAQALRGVAARTVASLAPARPLPRLGTPRRIALGIAAAAVLVVAAVWLKSQNARPGAAGVRAASLVEAPSAAPVSSAPTIAVLPFSTVGASDTVQFGRSAALMLSEALAQRNAVGTVDGNTLLSRWIAEHRSVSAPLDSNARFAYALGANQMVVGNYIESGRTFRLALALYDTHDVTRVWGDEVTGSTDSLFTLLDRLATRVALALCAQPSYNPANICYDTPARPRAPLTLASAPDDSGPPVAFYARVSAEGQVNDIRLQATSGGDERASQALGVLRDARFEPARRGGRAVAAWASVQVEPLRSALSGAGAGAGAPPTATCGEIAFAVRNPDHACYDTRPVPRVAPVVAPPASCTAAPEPVNLQLRIATSGAPAGTPTMLRGSGCAAFDSAALARVPAITFVPATKGGRPVDAWIILQIKPASAAAAGY